MLARIRKLIAVPLDTEYRSAHGAIILLIVVSILIAGLWPLNFRPANKVAWIKNRNGLSFYGQGMVVSDKPFESHQPVLLSGSVTIELLVRPLKEDTRGVPYMLTFYDNSVEQLIIGQWRTDLIIRLPAPEPYGNKRYREIGISDVLTKDENHFVTLVSEKAATSIYHDGKLKDHFPALSLFAPGTSLSGYLILGNSPIGTHSWNGTFFGLALYNRTLSSGEILDHYRDWTNRLQRWSELSVDSSASHREEGINRDNTRDEKKFLNAEHVVEGSYRGLPSNSNKPVALYFFDERTGTVIRDHAGRKHDLLVPPIFQPLRRTILGMPSKGFLFSRANMLDIAINILGFIPFGYYFSAWLRYAKKLKSSAADGISLFLGFCISLVIELTQVYLPTRDSSLLDIINNTIGMVIGIYLLNYLLPATSTKKWQNGNLP